MTNHFKYPNSSREKRSNVDKNGNFIFNNTPSERLRIIKFLTYESSHSFNQAQDLRSQFGFQEIHPWDELLIMHSRRVSEFSVKLGKELGLDTANLLELKIAGMLHDIGKVYIPNEIIQKPGKLDESNKKIVRTHTTLGYDILKSLNQYKEIAKYARSHHERIDGKGYPDGLKGMEIPLGSRIIAVVDAYEAMTESRPYRQPFTQKAAVEELRKHAGTQFDGKIVEVFVNKVLGFK
jgi:putative nucleotidyltransferase with HDIG domain